MRKKSSYLLFGSGKACSVYPGLQNNRQVSVTGAFGLSKTTSNRHFSNVIEASDTQPAA